MAKCQWPSYDYVYDSSRKHVLIWIHMDSFLRSSGSNLLNRLVDSCEYLVGALQMKYRSRHESSHKNTEGVSQDAAGQYQDNVLLTIVLFDSASKGCTMAMFYHNLISIEPQQVYKSVRPTHLTAIIHSCMVSNTLLIMQILAAAVPCHTTNSWTERRIDDALGSSFSSLGEFTRRYCSNGEASVCFATHASLPVPQVLSDIAAVSIGKLLQNNVNVDILLPTSREVQCVSVNDECGANVLYAYQESNGVAQTTLSSLIVGTKKISHSFIQTLLTTHSPETSTKTCSCNTVSVYGDACEDIGYVTDMNSLLHLVRRCEGCVILPTSCPRMHSESTQDGRKGVSAENNGFVFVDTGLSEQWMVNENSVGEMKSVFCSLCFVHRGMHSLCSVSTCSLDNNINAWTIEMFWQPYQICQLVANHRVRENLVECRCRLKVGKSWMSLCEGGSLYKEDLTLDDVPEKLSNEFWKLKDICKSLLVRFKSIMKLLDVTKEDSSLKNVSAARRINDLTCVIEYMLPSKVVLLLDCGFSPHEITCSLEKVRDVLANLTSQEMRFCNIDSVIWFIVRERQDNLPMFVSVKQVRTFLIELSVYHFPGQSGRAERLQQDWNDVLGREGIMNVGPLHYEQIEFPQSDALTPATSFVSRSYPFYHEAPAILSFQETIQNRQQKMFLLDFRVNGRPVCRNQYSNFVQWLFRSAPLHLTESIPDKVTLFYVTVQGYASGFLTREKLKLRKTKSGMTISSDLCIECRRDDFENLLNIQLQPLANSDKDAIEATLVHSLCLVPWVSVSTESAHHQNEHIPDIESTTVNALERLRAAVSIGGGPARITKFLPNRDADETRNKMCNGSSDDTSKVSVRMLEDNSSFLTVDLSRNTLMSNSHVVNLGQSSFSWTLMMENEQFFNRLHPRKGFLRNVDRFRQWKITPQISKFISYVHQSKVRKPGPGNNTEHPIQFSVYRLLQQAVYQRELTLENTGSMKSKGLFVSRLTSNFGNMACRVFPWDMLVVSSVETEINGQVDYEDVQAAVESSLGHRRGTLTVNTNKIIKSSITDSDMIRACLNARVMCFLVDPRLYKDLLKDGETVENLYSVVVAVDLFEDRFPICIWVIPPFSSLGGSESVEDSGNLVEAITNRVESCIKEAYFLSFLEIANYASSGFGNQSALDFPATWFINVEFKELQGFVDYCEHSTILDITNCIHLAILLTRSWILENEGMLKEKVERDSAVKEYFSLPLWSVGSALERVCETLAKPISSISSKSNVESVVQKSRQMMILKQMEKYPNDPLTLGSSLLPSKTDGKMPDPLVTDGRPKRKHRRSHAPLIMVSIFSEKLGVSIEIEDNRFVSVIGKLVYFWYLSAHRGGNHSMFLDSLSMCDFQIRVKLYNFWNTFTGVEEWSPSSLSVTMLIYAMRASLATSLLEMDALLDSRYGSGRTKNGGIETMKIDVHSVFSLVAICEPFFAQCQSQVFNQTVLPQRAFKPEAHFWKVTKKAEKSDLTLGLLSEMRFWVLDKERANASFWDRIMACLTYGNFSAADPNIPWHQRHILKIRKAPGQSNALTWLLQVYIDYGDYKGRRKEQNVGAVYICFELDYNITETETSQVNRANSRSKYKNKLVTSSSEEHPVSKCFGVLSTNRRKNAEATKKESRGGEERKFVAPKEVTKTYHESIGNFRAKIILLSPRHNPVERASVKHKSHRQILSEVAGLIYAAAHKANQIILMEDLHNKRVAESLLLPPSEQDEEYDAYQKYILSVLAQQASCESKKRKENRKLRRSSRVPSLVGHFSAPRQAVVALPIHPQISKSNISGTLATSVLSPFAISNRANAFVYEASQDAGNSSNLLHFINPPIHYIHLRVCSPIRVAYVLYDAAFRARREKQPNKATLPEEVASLCRRTRQNFLLIEYYGLSRPSKQTIDGIRRVIAQRLHSMLENSLFSVLSRNPRFHLSRSHFYLVRRCQLENIANWFYSSESVGQAKPKTAFGVLITPSQASNSMQLPLNATAAYLEKASPAEVSYVDVATKTGKLNWKKELLVGFFARLQRDLNVWLTPVDSSYWEEIPSFPYFSVDQRGISESRPCPFFEDPEFDEDDSTLCGRALAFGFINPPQQVQSHLSKGRINPSHLQRRPKPTQNAQGKHENSSQDRRLHIMEKIGQGFGLVHVTLVSQQLLHENDEESSQPEGAPTENTTHPSQQESPNVQELQSLDLEPLNQEDEKVLVDLLVQSERLMLSNKWCMPSSALESQNAEAELLATAGQYGETPKSDKTSDSVTSKQPSSSVTALSKIPLPRSGLTNSIRDKLLADNIPVLLLQVWLPQKLQSKSWQLTCREELMSQLKSSVREAWTRTIRRSIEFIESFQSRKDLNSSANEED